MGLPLRTLHAYMKTTGDELVYALEEFVNQSPAARGLRIVIVFYQHLKWFISLVVYRSFSRDVITFQNLKLKIHQSFYPHQA